MRQSRNFVVGAVVLLVALAGCKGGQDGSDAGHGRVLVFGVDGGTWTVIEEMFEAGELPRLRELYDGGVRGILESRPPVLSPVVWSTIFTGRLHAEHGVSNWKTSQSQHRKVKAVWEVSSEADLMTHVFNVPSTWPAVPVNGVMLSGFPLSGSTIGGNTGTVVTRDGVTKRGVPGCYMHNAATIREQMDELEVGAWSPYFAIEIRGRPSWQARLRVKRLGDDSYYLSPCYRIDKGIKMSFPSEVRGEIDAELGEPYIPEGPGWSKHAEEETPSYLYDHLVQVARNQTRAASMFAADPWNLFIYINTLVDRVSHPYWAYMHPEDFEGLDRDKAGRYQDAVRNAYRETDRQLGEVLDAASGEFYVVIVSDHGFKSNSNKKQYIGTHHFDGIYLVAGPGLEGKAGERAFIEDVGPTVLYLLNMPVGQDMKGRVIPEVAAAIGRPVVFKGSYEDVARAGSDEPVDAKTWEQLRGLGYVDGEAPTKNKGRAGAR